MKFLPYCIACASIDSRQQSSLPFKKPRILHKHKPDLGGQRQPLRKRRVGTGGTCSADRADRVVILWLGGYKITSARQRMELDGDMIWKHVSKAIVHRCPWNPHRKALQSTVERSLLQMELVCQSNQGSGAGKRSSNSISGQRVKPVATPVVSKAPRKKEVFFSLPKGASDNYDFLVPKQRSISTRAQ